MAKHDIKIDANKCIGCGLCANVCVAHNIELKNGKADILTDNCILCGHCSAVCPKEAVAITGYETKPILQKETVRLNPDDVLNVIRFEMQKAHYLFYVGLKTDSYYIKCNFWLKVNTI